MFSNHEYVCEKLRAFHAQGLDRESSRPTVAARQETLVRSMVSAGGRAMRRLGDGMERWARMEPEGRSQPVAEYVRPNDLEPCTDC